MSKNQQPTFTKSVEKKMRAFISHEFLVNLKKNRYYYVKGQGKSIIYDADDQNGTLYMVTYWDIKQKETITLMDHVRSLSQNEFEHIQFKLATIDKINAIRPKLDKMDFLHTSEDGGLRTLNQQGQVVGVDYSLEDDYAVLVSAAMSPYQIATWAIANNKDLLPLNADSYTLSSMVKRKCEEFFKYIDHNRCRLPILDDEQLKDKNMGLWELFGEDIPSYFPEYLRPRDPALDVHQHLSIGIDFGTSSTVVAYENESGKARLLRIGVQNFKESPQAWHYENPTALEFINFNKFLNAWKSDAYQPFVDWDHVHCSHEARSSLFKNQDKPQVIASILMKLKQWALKEVTNPEAMIFSDQENQDREYQLSPLAANFPVKGELLQVDDNYSFDPIELYAWFLGLAINYRSRGIFLKYYLTFPVAYPKDVKEKVLASFNRGLLRSLPLSLAKNSEIMEKFGVEELASEPAAYVAVAMDANKIEPTEEGVPYAVFDFGGGTSDFDFGYYRWATEEEEVHNYEYVFERLKPAGDNYLGGENLLENLAYLVFKEGANLDVCRKLDLSFTKPAIADDFAGSEQLISRSQIAYANTLVMMGKMREFLHTQKREANGIVKVNMLSRTGELKSNIEFEVDYDELMEYLENRILKGIESFYIAMKTAFGSDLPEQIHILLSGNSSRSAIVADFFGFGDEEQNSERLRIREEKITALQKQIFGRYAPEFIVHPPLDADATDDSVPTAKTGVALGILQLLPGKGIKVINHYSEESGDEAPFKFYVGISRRRKFEPKLKRNAIYQQWVAVGNVSSENPVMRLYYTESDLAMSNDGLKDGDPALKQLMLEFSNIGSTPEMVFVRAIAPNQVEICLAKDETSLEQDQKSNVRTIQLT